MTELYEFFGDANYPATDVVNEQLYSSFDPGRDILLGLFAAAINQELGGSTTDVLTTSRWGIARVGTRYELTLPVADTYYEVPDKETLRKADLAFPFLALGRTDGEPGEQTLQIENDTCRWSLDYVLGPLKEEDKRRLGGVLKGVRDIIQLCIRRRGHPAYDDGALQFFEGTGGFSSIRAINYQMGPAEFGERGAGLIFHALHMTLETVEVEGAQEDSVTPFEGVSITIGAGGPGGVLPDLIEARTEIPVQDPLIVGAQNPEDS